MSLPSMNKRVLRACVRDLVALSTSQAEWMDGPMLASAEGVRDLVGRILHADAVCVRVIDHDTGRRVVAVSGATDQEFEDALNPDRASRPGSAGTLSMSQLVSAPIGMNERQGLIAVCCVRTGFPSPLETMLIRAAANQAAISVQHAALLARHKRAERQLAQQAAQQAAVARLGARALAGG